jgi:hypothetical protein
MSRQTILAARRVVPPLLMAPAARSPILSQDISPLELAAAGELLALAAEVAEVGARARAVLEEAGLADPQVHDAALVHQVVIDALDEARVRLRVRVRVLGQAGLAGLGSAIQWPCAGPVMPYARS